MDSLYYCILYLYDAHLDTDFRINIILIIVAVRQRAMILTLKSLKSEKSDEAAQCAN